MIIYSFDTGITTGVSAYDTDKGEVVFRVVDENGLVNILMSFYEGLKPDFVVIERIPTSSEYTLLKLFQQVVDTCVILSISFRIIAPTTWKPIAKARNWKCSAPIIHERDSFCLLRYFLLANHKFDIGDV